MLRPFATGIGVALIVLAAIGFLAGVQPWICAAHLCAGLWAFATVPLVRVGEEGGVAVGWPSILAITLLLLGVVALTAHVTAWMTIATFVASAVTAAAAVSAAPGGFSRFRQAHIGERRIIRHH